MTGLDRITGKLLSDAEAEASAILEASEAECAEIRAGYEARAEKDREAQTAAAEKECENLITRARSAAAIEKRNIALSVKTQMLDRVYAEAYKTLKNLPEDAYLGLLVKLLAGALTDLLECNRKNAALYGEDDESIAVGTFEVLLNEHDREAYAETLLEGTRRAVIGKVDASLLERLFVAKETAPIDGGVILRCGNVETNCALSTVFAAWRDKTEQDVAKTLFA